MADDRQPLQATTIKPGDRVRCELTPTMTYTVIDVREPPPDLSWTGPVAVFAEGGYWRCSALKKV